MRRVVSAVVLGLAATVGLSAQRGPATFAVHVADPAGKPISGVMVTLSGPAERSASTEGGRIAFENLPTGRYHFRFAHRDYETLERDVVGRRGKPVDVTVTLTPKVAPVEAPPPAPQPPADVEPVALDLPTFIEQHYVGKAAGKSTEIACGSDGAATLIQINDPIAEHTHEADEFVYVIAGQGAAHIGRRDEPLAAGMFVMIPRGAAHGFTAGPKKPLVMIATRAGGACAR